jgi:hypothetical protein
VGIHYVCILVPRHPGPGLSIPLRQDPHPFPLAGQGVAERSRVGKNGQAPAVTDRLNRAGQRGSPTVLGATPLVGRPRPHRAADVPDFCDRWITVIPTPVDRRRLSVWLTVEAVHALGRKSDGTMVLDATPCTAA